MSPIDPATYAIDDVPSVTAPATDDVEAKPSRVSLPATSDHRRTQGRCGKKTKDFEEDLPFNFLPSRFKDARIDHHLRPNGVIRRFVVLKDKRLRKLLGQPRRREIEALNIIQKPLVDGEPPTRWKKSELWEIADRDAVRLLRALYAKAAELEQLEASENEAHRPTRHVRSKAQPITQLDAGEARGILLSAGLRESGTFGIDLYDEENGRVYRIEDIDLARALQVSGAQPFEVVQVRCTGDHSVQIHEDRTGSHGEGQRTFRRGRRTYEIVREDQHMPPVKRGIGEPQYGTAEITETSSLRARR